MDMSKKLTMDKKLASTEGKITECKGFKDHKHRFLPSLNLGTAQCYMCEGCNKLITVKNQC